MSLSWDEAAARVVADLMPIAIVVASTGGGEARFVRALGEAGAGAEAFAPGMAAGFDLAVLLAAPGDVGEAFLPGLIADLAAISDRLLFVPAESGSAAPALDAWFELFAEQGYQPVVDYDASFLGQGAFLVDRNTTAAETELAAFADRLSLGGALAASTQRVAVLEAELGTGGDREAIKAQLVERLAELEAAAARAEAWRVRAEAAEASYADLRGQLDGWTDVAKVLGGWVQAVCGAPDRNGLAALRAASGFRPRRRLLARLLPARPGRVELQNLADAALIRGHRLFDAGWYIATHPELAESGGDPVWHYVLRGAAAGADPGPWFDAAAYRAAHPEVAGNPLAQAIRHGHVDAA